MAEALIVGIDPGTTSAVAAINLDGELKLLKSEKEFAHHKIIRCIVETGKPVIVACDTEKMPSTVEKIASSLGAEKFMPEEDLDSKWKTKRKQGENSHEKDAFASALNAYRNLQREIRKIKEFSNENEERRSKVAETYFTGDMNRLRES